jgi:hypothetical protein
MSEDEEDEQIDDESSPLVESIEEDDVVTAQPVEIVREEIVTVAENPNAGTFSEEGVSVIDNNTEIKDGLYKLVKAHSVQLDRLTDLVESLQSQVKRLEGTRLRSSKATSTRITRMKTKKSKDDNKKTKGKSTKRRK